MQLYLIQVDDMKGAETFILMLGLIDIIDQLAMVNNVCWYGNVLSRQDGHVLRREDGHGLKVEIFHVMRAHNLKSNVKERKEG